MPFLGKTPTKLLDANVNIDGGNIDGTTIGATSAASATVTTFTSTGIDDNATSTAITIDSSENVGIGTAPNTALHVSSATTTKSVVETSGTSSDALIEFTRGQGSGNSWSIGLDQSASSALSFAYLANGSPSLTTHSKMVIDSSGNVGIGTASPDGKLNVFSASAGSVSADADADELVLENSGNVGLSLLTASTGESGIYFGNPGTNGQKDFYLKYYHESHATTANRRAFTFNTASTERMRIDSSGNVGIGTTSPNYPLHLNKSDSAGCWAQFTNSTTGTGSAAGALVGIDSNEDFRILQYEAKALALYTSATERMRISSSGFVGIGTSSPDRYLHVNQSRSGDWLAEIHNTHATNGYGLKVRAGDDANVSAMRVTDVSNNTLMEIQGGGNVGIGTTSPASELNVYHATDPEIRLTIATHGDAGVLLGDADGLKIYGKGNGNQMRFYTGTTERMRIDSSGNVGIGTASPNSLLDVKSQGANNEVIRVTNSYDNQHFVIKQDGSGGFSLRSSVDLDFHADYDNNTADAASRLRFFTDASERMRIDASGNLLVGTTTNPSNGKVAIDYARGTSAGMRIKDTVGSGGTGVIADFYNSSNTSMGAITHDSSNITYGGTSDYRLKENLNYEFDGLATVAQLKPTKFTWIDNPNVGVVYGFIAHEVSDVVDQAVVGEKDAVNEDGSVKPQMLDQSKLIPFLTKAIQEQQAMIEELKAEVAALKGA